MRIIFAALLLLVATFAFAQDSTSYTMEEIIFGRKDGMALTMIKMVPKENAKGKGLGKLCLQFAMKEAKKRELKTLLGFIFGHNEPSLRLFYSLGFEKWAQLPEVADMEGVWRDLIILGKKVE